MIELFQIFYLATYTFYSLIIWFDQLNYNIKKRNLVKNVEKNNNRNTRFPFILSKNKI